MAWSNLHDFCIQCGTTDRTHQAHGLCTLCHNRKKASDPEYLERKNAQYRKRRAARLGYECREEDFKKWSDVWRCCRDCGTVHFPHVQDGYCGYCLDAKEAKAKVSRNPYRIGALVPGASVYWAGVKSEIVKLHKDGYMDIKSHQDVYRVHVAEIRRIAQ